MRPAVGSLLSTRRVRVADGSNPAVSSHRWLLSMESGVGSFRSPPLCEVSRKTALEYHVKCSGEDGLNPSPCTTVV